MYFDELALSDEVLDALWDMHFDTCTPVQEQTIPVILDGHDVISCAQTGTGKGSLSPTFVSVRLASLTVKLPSAFTLNG